MSTSVQGSGVCKVNGVVIVVNCCHSIGSSTTNNNKNTVYFANTGNWYCAFPHGIIATVSYWQCFVCQSIIVDSSWMEHSETSIKSLLHSTNLMREW